MLSVRKQLDGITSNEKKGEWFTQPWTWETLASFPQTGIVPANPVSAQTCDPIPAIQLDPMIEEAAKREGVGIDLVRAVIHKESAYRPCVVSPKGAQGLMQLMPVTAHELGVTDPFDPQQSLAGGTRYLRQLMDRYQGKLDLVLSAYNAGPATVDRAGTIPDIPETRNYVRDILSKLTF